MRNRGFTLVEFMVCVALGTMIMAAVVTLTLFGTRSFISMGNYADLDNQSRNALDLVSRDIREATGVIALQTNPPILSLTLTNANQGQAYFLSWNSNTSNFKYRSTALGTETLLTGCDSWNFSLYQRTPLVTATNITFFLSTNLSGNLDFTLCKLVQMSWHCSRTILSQKINTESMQTAQIVLRNKT